MWLRQFITIAFNRVDSLDTSKESQKNEAENNYKYIETAGNSMQHSIYQLTEVGMFPSVSTLYLKSK